MSTTFLPRSTDYCKGCPLEHTPAKSKHVPTEIVRSTDDKRVDVYFVGEAPGENEALECRPFIGKSGKFVRSHIAKHANCNYAIGNTTRCRPVDEDGNNRAPTPEERAHCFRYTLDQIHKLKPKKIVTLGGVATGAFIDGFSSVAAIRGQSLPWKSPKGFETTLCPTYHPAARDMYQLTFIPKDIRNVFEGGSAKKVKWDRPFKLKTVVDFDRVRKLFKHIFSGLKSEDVVEVDVETTNGVDRLRNRLLSISFCWDGDTAYGIPLEHRKAPWTPQELKKIKKWMRRLFSAPNPSFRFWEAHNAVMEIQQLHTYLGIWPRNRPWLDTMLLTFLNDENRLTLKKTKNFKPYGLKQLSSEKLGIRYEDYVSEELLKDVEKGNLPKYSVKDVCEYNGLDTIAARRLHDKEKIDAGSYWETMLRISEFIYAPASLMFSAAEKNGFKIDIDLLYELQGPNSPVLKAMKDIDTFFHEDEDVISVNKKLANKESGGMRPMFGSPWVFSLDKKQHLMKLFIDRLGFEPVKFSKKTEEPSLDTEYYETYSNQSPLAKKMAERQEIKKLVTSYFNQILAFLEDDSECADGRVRPSFWLNSTVTGRTCIAKGTMVDVVRDLSRHPEGIPIEKVKVGDWAYTFDDNLNLALRRVKWVGKTGVKRVVRVHWQGSGHQHKGYVDLTPDHEVRLVDGSYLKVENLSPGDRVRALSRDTGKGSYSYLYPTGGITLREHRFVYSQLHDGEEPEHVHHDNENKLDHRPKNLIGMTSSAHTSMHSKKISPEKRASAGLKISGLWKEPDGPYKNSVRKGDRHGRWLGLSKRGTLSLLKKNGWSVTKASRSSGIDFITLKKYALSHGIDLEMMKKRAKPKTWSKLRRDHQPRHWSKTRRENHPHTYNHEIVRLEYLPGKTEVYDLEVGGTHNFFANEICIHNSCSNPNLQQIPRAENDYSRAAKNMFTVEPGNVLVSADMTQGEVILMAQQTGDKLFASKIWRMKEIKDRYWRNPSSKLKVLLETECDVHRQSAAILYDVPVDKVTKEQRSKAKAIVTFGIIYGKHIKTIAMDLGCTEEEAQKVQDKFFAKFIESKKGLMRLEKMAETLGYVESSIGRRRRLPQALSPDRGESNRAKRQARNSPIQSLLSDYTLFQAGRLHQYILDKGKDWKIVDVVHDAVITEVPYAEVKEYITVTRKIMTDITAFAEAFQIKMIVPMLVDFDAGIQYGNLKGIESWSKGDKSLKKALKWIKEEWETRGYGVDLRN